MSKNYIDPYDRQFSFNDHVCVECLMGVPDEKRTGRLVQVRKGAGAFGSDIYLVRLRDKGLASFENAMIRHAGDKQFENAFYRSNGKTPPAIPQQPPYTGDDENEGDSEQVEYTITGKWPETGFLIEKPKQPESEKQSFSMMVTKG